MAKTPQRVVFLNGRVDIFERSLTGAPINGIWAGNVPELSFDITVEKDELRESYTGQNTILSTVITGKTLRGTATMNDHSLKQFERNLQATVTPVAAGSATDVPVATDPEAGQVFALDHINLSAVVLKVGGTTLVEDEDYSIDLKTARGVFIVAQTGAVTADPTWLAYSEVEAFQAAQKEYYLRYSGKSATDGNPFVVTCYKTRFEPATGLGVIGSQHGSYTTSFDILPDEYRNDKTMRIQAVEATA